MGALLGNFIRIALQVLAGVGIGSVIDKVAADKVPNYEPIASDLTPGKPGFKPMKLLFTVLALGVGAMILMFIGKKMRIKLLK